MRDPSLLWFARHELRLGWRDISAMLFGGSLRRRVVGATILGLAAILLHLVALAFVREGLRTGIAPEPRTLVTVTGLAVLSWCLLLAQSIESVTRAFYARGDLDLILSSPSPARDLFAVRIVGIGASCALMAMGLSIPIVDALVVLDGPRWLAILPTLAAFGASAAAAAVMLTALLFRYLGAKRTRFAAQVVAAIVGAGFAICIQAIAILSFDDPSRLTVLSSDWLLGLAPAPESPVWHPARALLGDGESLLLVLGWSLALLVAAISVVAPRFAIHAVEAAGHGAGAAQVREIAERPFRDRSPSRVLREKEWTLLRRDPWLLSQTLMQILYLIPAALLLWRSFGEDGRQLAVIVPVLVMAAGQLAGGLAWLAVSGEDAPDLVRTAPVLPGLLVRAKIEAVLGAVGLAVAPFLLVLAALEPATALIAAGGIAIASISATAIQLWFRSQARRSQFRRRQTSSRVATFSEALSSILWACGAAFAAQGIWILAAFVAGITAVMLVGIRALSPKAA